MTEEQILLNTCNPDQEKCKEILFIKQEINNPDVEIDECKFKLEADVRDADENEGADLLERDVTNVDNAIKQEIDESCLKDMDVKDGDIQGVGDEEMVIKDEVTLEEEDVKTSLTDWEDSAEPKTITDFVEHEGGESNLESKPKVDLKNNQALGCVYKKNCENNLNDNFKFEHDVKPQMLQCAKCIYTTTNKQLLVKHMRGKHGNVIYKCVICNFQTKYLKYLKTHEEVKHNTSDKIFQCSECLYQTKSKIFLLQHIRRKHSNPAVLYKCPECTFQTKYKYSLKKHCKVKHDKNAADKYKCTKCPYTTKTKGNLSRHNKVKHDISTVIYRCTKCTYKTKYKHGIRQHYKLKHDKNVPIYKCTKCTFETKYKGYFTIHNRTKHNVNSEVYKCTECTYETQYKPSLTTHYRVKHDKDETVYKCTKCIFKSRYKSALKQHNKLKHDKNVEILKCSKCRYETKCKQLLKKHIKRKHAQRS